ncbi:MAG: electron transfer flavoprotein subunit alpha/FixB family protein [Candidatus Lokiarchaeota archaeon]|nr:electron transfer flavoprotein subunit alpha/FixB family protein [Candidatus Lokiarchaeota archaeon]
MRTATAKLIIHQDKVKDPQALIDECPFAALEYVNNYLNINAACKMCKSCVKKHPDIFEFVEDVVVAINKDEWRGIAVYVEHFEGKIHPVTLELVGKARQLATKTGHPVFCLFAGHGITGKAQELLPYGPDEVFVYDNPALKHFRIEPYTAVFEDFISKIKPSTILVGGTTIGRSLAPRVAARFHTGLTADCTVLDMQPNTDLDQIRPAFGGNIMAHIRTPNNRPQFATVRYKIFDVPAPCAPRKGAKITVCNIDETKLASNITVHDILSKQKAKTIEDAEVIVVAGRGIKKQEDLGMIQELATALGGQMATTRPLIEAGWADPAKQIGLSGRTVKPKLIITCGVSGSIQFRAGMGGSDLIIAINTDEKAPIFSIAHHAVIGDVYKIVPALTERIKAGTRASSGACIEP